MFKIKFHNGHVVIAKEIFVVLLMDIFAVMYYVSSRRLSEASLMFPRFLFLGIVLFSIFSFVQSIHIYKDDDEQMKEKIRDASGFGISKKLVLFIILVLITLLLFNIAGALVCCWGFLAGSMWLLDVRDKRVLILIPSVEVIFIYFVFVVWLAVPLPEGFLTFL